MKAKIVILLAIVIASFAAQNAFAGNCRYPDDTAADGSRCGGRAASERPGGD